MKKLVTLFVLVLIISFALNAQQINVDRGANICSHQKMLIKKLWERVPDSPNSPLHSFDVLKYTINVDITNCMISPYPHNFTGDVTILFEVDSTLNQIVLDADNTSLSIDSIRMNCISYTQANNNLTIQLDRIYNPGEEATVHIYYKHANVVDYAFYAKDGFAFTDCEPEGARKWFPCYDRPCDKALTDITAKVPLTARLGSNGKLQDSIIEGNTIKYHWVSRDPVATYLTVLTARVNYNLDIVNWTNPNTDEVIPMRFYYNPGENPVPIENMMNDLTTFYSQEYGDHPFEKNGFATLNSDFAWGGMENQSLTSLCPDCWMIYYIAHEFAHQWFGDMVTCATWADIFLNEGFATWSEAHYTEHQYGYASYMNEMKANADSYFAGNPQWPISSPAWAVSTPSVGVLFNYSITYMKGSCVLHMLRYTMGDDKFFPALKAYATDTTNFKYKSSTIEDFKNKMASESGMDLDWFFDQWIYKPNHPIYQNVYGIEPSQTGGWTVNFTAQQQAQPLLPYFQMPIELLINFKDGTDSTIRVFNSFNGQIFSFDFAKQPLLVTFDPNDNILLKQGTTTVGLAELPSSGKGFTLQVKPNPIGKQSEIVFQLLKPEFITADLYNNTGVKIRTLFSQDMTEGEHLATFDSEGLKPGMYFVVMRDKEHTEVVKVVKNK